MDSIQIDNSHIEEQNQNNEVSYKDSNQNHKILNYLPSQANNKPKYASLASNDCGENFESHSNVNTLTVLHHNSNKNLHFPHNLLLKNSVCSSNTQSTSSLHNENFNTGAMYQNRNSYSNLHRRNSGKASQGSYSQLNNQRIQNSRNNSRAELCQHPEENQSPYNNRHYNSQNSNSEAVQNLSTKSNLKKMEKSNPTLSLRDKFVAPNQTMNDHSSSTGNFSFRK